MSRAGTRFSIVLVALSLVVVCMLVTPGTSNGSQPATSPPPIPKATRRRKSGSPRPCRRSAHPRWLRSRRCARGSRAGTAACAYGPHSRAMVASDAETVPILIEVFDDEDPADVWQRPVTHWPPSAPLRERPGTEAPGGDIE